MTLAERRFVEASVAVWREIDAVMERSGGVYRSIEETERGTELRRIEREAWEAYKAELDRGPDNPHRESVTDALKAAIEANIAALRRPEGVGFPDGHVRCLIVADDLQRALAGEVMGDPTFAEDDESAEDVRRAFDQGEKGVTTAPVANLGTARTYVRNWPDDGQSSGTDERERLGGRS